MNFQQVLTAIDETYHRADAHLARMELELLSSVLVERSQLVSVFVEGVNEWPVSGEARHDALETIARQNKHLVARLTARRDGAQARLDELTVRTRGLEAYNAGTN